MKDLVVTTYKGIDILYNPIYKHFSIEADGETANYSTQEGAEKRINAIGKAKQKKIKLLKIERDSIQEADLTSYNPDTHEVWITDGRSLYGDTSPWRSGRHKEHLRYGGLSNYFKATAKNIDIAAQIIEKMKEKEEIVKQIGMLKVTMTDPVSKEMFKEESK